MANLISFISSIRVYIYKVFFTRYINTIASNERIYHIFTNNNIKKISLFTKRNKINDKFLVVCFFNVYREVCKRFLSIRIRNYQVEGSIASVYNFLVEMGTGQGKTLAILSSMIWKLIYTDNIVHFVTSNSYLVERDYIYTKPVISFYNVKSQIDNGSANNISYKPRLIYSTIQNLGFKFLNNIVNPINKFNYIFDLIFIDEIDTFLYETIHIPLSISYNSKNKSDNYTDLYYINNLLGLNRKSISDNIYQIYLLNINLLNNNYSSFLSKIDNFYWTYNISILVKSFLDLQKNLDFISNKGRITLLDRSTGRPMDNHKLSGGLQEALEVRENSISFQSSLSNNSLNLYEFISLYKKMLGFSATLGTELYLSQIDKSLLVYKIKSSSRRMDYRPIALSKFFADLLAKDWIFYKQNKKQPLVLYIENIKNLLRSEKLLFKQNFRRSLVLNASNVKDEVDILDKSGNYNQILLSTNIVSRGSNISLGKSNKSHTENSILQMLGGVYLCYYDFAKTAMFLDQLIGRVGRQNNPGESRSLVVCNSLLVKGDTNTFLLEKDVSESGYSDKLYITNQTERLASLYRDKQQDILVRNIKLVTSAQSNLPSYMFLYSYINNLLTKEYRSKKLYVDYMEQKTTLDLLSKDILLDNFSLEKISYLLSIHIDSSLLENLFYLQKKSNVQLNIQVYIYLLTLFYKKINCKLENAYIDPSFQIDSIIIYTFLQQIEKYRNSLKNLQNSNKIPSITLNRENDTNKYISDLNVLLLLENFYKHFFLSTIIRKNRVIK